MKFWKKILIKKLAKEKKNNKRMGIKFEELFFFFK
jgi:hypothetical protein